MVFPNTVFNCNPEHIQVFNPIPIDVDRTKFLCWQLFYPGDETDPEYAEYKQRMLRALGAPEGRRRRGHQHLRRSSPAPSGSSGYQKHILSSREFKIAHYHEKMAEMISR